jgi:hypothetical protein
MCRSIQPLFNFNPPASEGEIRAAATQYVRKISGYPRPSQVNQIVFEVAIDEIARATRTLLDNLVTKSPPRDRQIEVAKAKARSAQRFERS